MPTSPIFPDSLDVPSRSHTLIIEVGDDSPVTVSVSSDPTGTGFDAIAQRTHRSKQRTKCPLCHVELLKKTLSRHIRTKHEPEDSRALCLLCGLTCKRGDILERHLREQHGSVSNKVQCEVCGDHVHPRAFKEHRESQRCKTARFIPQQSGLGTVSMLDPLVIAAYLHRLTMLAWWTTEPIFRIRLMNSLDTLPNQNTCYHLHDWQSEAFALEMSIVYHSPTDEMPHNLQLPPTNLLELWELRGLALTQTTELVKQNMQRGCVAFQSAQTHDDIVMRVSLLNAADRFIFGKDSPEHMIHARGLSCILETRILTPGFVPRFESLLTHTWHGTGILPACARDRRSPINQVPRTLKDAYFQDIQEQHKTEVFWSNFIPGVWGIWKPASLERIHEAGNIPSDHAYAIGKAHDDDYNGSNKSVAISPRGEANRNGGQGVVHNPLQDRLNEVLQYWLAVNQAITPCGKESELT